MKSAIGLGLFLQISFWALIAILAVVVVCNAGLLISGERMSDLGDLIISFNGISIEGIDISGIDFTRIFTMMTILFVVAGTLTLYGIRVVQKRFSR